MRRGDSSPKKRPHERIQINGMTRGIVIALYGMTSVERCGLFLSGWNQDPGNETSQGEKEMAWKLDLYLDIKRLIFLITASGGNCVAMDF